MGKEVVEFTGPHGVGGTILIPFLGELDAKRHLVPFRENSALPGLTIELKTRKFDPNHDERGRFSETDSKGNKAPKLKSVKSKVFNGESVEIKSSPSKLEIGALGEQIATQWLKDQGHEDARSLNVKVNNFPVDLVQDHHAIEVKAGLVSNSRSAQQWRATIGQPGTKESEWLKTASATAKANWNLKKQQAILDRKQGALKVLSKEFGRKVQGSTVALIINPDKKQADLYQFKGFHLRIAWNSKEAKSAYVGTFAYGK